MSKIALSPNASGTALFTIASPATNTDRTLTLPDAAGTLDRLERAGNVLQVVQQVFTTEFSTTSTTYVDTGLTASITPSSSSNKILFIATISMDILLSTTSNQYAGLKVFRDSTVIRASQEDGTGPYEFDCTNSSYSTHNINYVILDNPATTSSVTYKIQARSYTTNNLNSLRLNRAGNVAEQNTGYITLVEIAA